MEEEIADALSVTPEEIMRATEDTTVADGENIDLNSWEEGTEEFKNWPVSRLRAALGVSATGAFPGMPEKYDTTGVHNPVSDPDFFNNPPENSPIRDVDFKWHQLVGILKIMRNAFDGKPVLLMDSVGVGKTLQIIGVIALLPYYREVFRTTGSFPGEFSESPKVTRLAA